jgi:hypothetical protein
MSPTFSNSKIIYFDKSPNFFNVDDTQLSQILIFNFKFK